MGLFLLKRVLTLIATLIGASIVIFLVLEILPGDAAQIMMGPDASPEAVDGEGPLARQLGHWPLAFPARGLCGAAVRGRGRARGEHQGQP